MRALEDVALDAQGYYLSTGASHVTVAAPIRHNAFAVVHLDVKAGTSEDNPPDPEARVIAELERVGRKYPKWRWRLLVAGVWQGWTPPVEHDGPLSSLLHTISLHHGAALAPHIDWSPEVRAEMERSRFRLVVDRDAEERSE